MESPEVASILDSLPLRVLETFEKLDKIWALFGYDESAIDRRRRTFVKHIVELLNEMLVEEENKVDKKKEDLSKLETDIEKLLKELGKTQVEAFPDCSKMSLLECELKLLATAKDLLQEKAARTEKYDKINEKVIEIHEEFGEPPFKIDFEGIPTDVQVAELEKHLRTLQEERKKRQQIFFKLRETLRHLYLLSGKRAVSALEQVCCADSNDVPTGEIRALSLQCLDEMEKLCDKCRKELEENETKAESLWQTIKELWCRLEIDEELQKKFSQDNGGYEAKVDEKSIQVYSFSIIENLSTEVERLKELKRLNISKFIKKIRSELIELWRTKCFLEKYEFRFQMDNYMHANDFSEVDFDSDIYTEELLDKFEKEIEFWKSFTEHYSTLIDTVSKRNEMFSQYEQFDIKSEDVSRFANRGGALLLEEKKRKRLEKMLPKLEEKLKSLNEKYLAENILTRFGGVKTFLVYGQTIPFMIEQGWEQFHRKKELRKEAKKLAQSEVQGSACKSLGTTQIQCGRKRANTPASQNPHTPSKKRMLEGISTPGKQQVGATRLKPTPKRKIATPGTYPRCAPEAKDTGKEQQDPEDKLGKIQGPLSPVSTYSEFQNNILGQSTLNSSIAPNRQLSKANQEAVTGTRAKSPLKSSNPISLALAPAPSQDIGSNF